MRDTVLGLPEDTVLGLQEAPPGRPVGAWIAVAAVLVAGALAGYVYFVRNAGVTPGATASVAPAPRRSRLRRHLPRRLEATSRRSTSPPLDQSDVAIRALVEAMSSHPRIAAWLTTNGLIRNFTVVVENIAAGKTPSVHLRALTLASPFRVVERQGYPTVDPGAYRRYDALAAAVASVDPTAAARLYGGIKPRIEEAYRELGHGDMPFDTTLERALVLLLSTPVTDAPPRLMRPPKGIGYAFADPQLESLTAAQKQLLRMGPDNARSIQSSLRAIAIALGIPESRLPARPA